MITFKQFIVESKTELDLDKLAELYRANCTQWQDIKKPLWRYSNSGSNASLGEPRERKTASRGGSAIMQKYMFSLPGWEEFPPRKTSIFCSTNKRFAVTQQVAQNKVFAIYPFDNTVMGYTEDKDLNLIKPFKSTEYQLSDVQFALRQAMSTVGSDDSEKGYYGDEAAFNAWVEGDIAKAIKLLKKQLPKYLKINPGGLKNIKATLAELPEALSPEGMGCTLVTPETIKLTGSQHEVWFSDKYLSIPQRDLEEFIKRVKAQP